MSSKRENPQHIFYNMLTTNGSDDLTVALVS